MPALQLPAINPAAIEPYRSFDPSPRRAPRRYPVNRSDRPSAFLEIGTRPNTDDGEYPDIDMKFEVRAGIYKAYRKGGEPYETASATGPSNIE